METGLQKICRSGRDDFSENGKIITWNFVILLVYLSRRAFFFLIFV
jgi:phage host-nuclease inhibitor protein Gam